MPSNVEIANLALDNLGTKTITSFEENSTQAKAVKRIFNLTRDALLRAHNWGFATRIEPLSLFSGETIAGFDYLYAYPTNCVFIRKIYNDYSLTLNSNGEPWKEVLSPNQNLRAIATNCYEAYVEFTYKVIDPQMFDDLFVAAFSYMLASKLAQPLMGDMNMSKNMLDTYVLMMNEAKRTNMTEVNLPNPDTNTLVNSRM